MELDPDDIVDLEFASRQDAGLQVELLSLADVLAVAPDAYERLGFTVLVLFPSKPLVHVLDFEQLVIEPGSVLRMSAGQVHRWRGSAAAGTDATLLVVAAPIADAAGLTRPTWRPTADNLIALDEDGRAVVLAIIGAMRASQAAFDGSSASRAEMYALVAALAARLAGAATQEGDVVDHSTSAITTAFLKELDSTGRRRSVDEVAQGLGYSPRHLARVVSQDTGRPPRAWLDERTILEAKRMLAHTELTAAAIAERLGFVDGSHFGRAFRRSAGASPSGFRAVLGR